MPDHPASDLSARDPAAAVSDATASPAAVARRAGDGPGGDGAAVRDTARDPAVRTLAMPADTNPAGDIFGGWLLAQMDVAAGTVAWQRAQGRVATVALDAMAFHAPVFVGDVVSCYAEVVRVGRTSITLLVQTWARRGRTGEELKVTEGHFTCVAIGDDRRPRPVPAEG
jgi:acyl-CoA thioesterase YciA